MEVILKNIYLTIICFLVGCSGGSGGSSSPNSPSPAPQNPDIVNEDSIKSVIRCNTVKFGLGFENVIYKFNNNDKYISCTIYDASKEVHHTTFYKSGTNGNIQEACLIRLDNDSTPSAGFWTFKLLGSVRSVVYSDSGSPDDGLTFDYLVSDCSVSTY